MSISCTISLLTAPAGTLPGQRTMNGTRSEPSSRREVGAAPRARPSRSRAANISGPLSQVKMKMVLSLDARVPRRRRADLADVGVHLRQRVGKVAVAGLALEVGVRQRRVVRLRERDIGEERLAGLPFWRFMKSIVGA